MLILLNLIDISEEYLKINMLFPENYLLTITFLVAGWGQNFPHGIKNGIESGIV